MVQIDLPLSAPMADYRAAMPRAIVGEPLVPPADPIPVAELVGLFGSGARGLRAELSPLELRVEMLEGELRGRRLIAAMRDDDRYPLTVALESIDSLLDRVADLRSQVDELSYPVREKIKAPTRRLLRLVIRTYYDGNCACCFTVLILNGADETAEYRIDHWVSRDDSRASSLWSVCNACNHKLGPANSPQRRDPETAACFDAFQAHLRESLNRQQRLTL